MGSLTTIVGRSIYLDANVLIYAVEDAHGFGERLRTLFERIDRGELTGVTSELSLAEVLVGPLRSGASRIQSEFEQLLDADGPLVVPHISRQILVNAARLRALHPPLKLPDAIHAATALLHGCTTFFTNDARFEAASDLPVMLLSRLE